jgi:ABC-type antimicrobial peptide transport system permease subunit
VSQRRREIGIRMALGAQAADILGLFVWRGLTLTGIGVAVGLVGAAGSTRLMRSLLFGIGPLDPIRSLRSRSFSRWSRCSPAICRRAEPRRWIRSRR